jgi:transcription elongation factor GreA
MAAGHAARHPGRKPTEREATVTEIVITEAGLERLKAELDRLRAVDSGGERDVGAEQALLERRIALLEEGIAHGGVVAPDPANGRVDAGERVTIRDVETEAVHELEIVGPLEVDPTRGRISVGSPIGSALLGRRPGDVVAVEAPRGLLRLEILAIDAGEPA